MMGSIWIHIWPGHGRPPRLPTAAPERRGARAAAGDRAEVGVAPGLDDAERLQVEGAAGRRDGAGALG